MRRLALLLLALPFGAGAQVFAEVGAAYAQNHGDGIWYQQAFPHTVQMASPTFALGYRFGEWSAGGAYLFRVTSKSQGTVLDADYDSKAHRCTGHCDAPATFETSGSAYGAFLRREWTVRGVTLELGGLVFRPQQTVYVSEWREGGLLSNPTNGRDRYENKTEWKFTPSFGAGWTSGPVRFMARFYPWIKTGGDGQGGITGLYNGPTFTFTVGF